MKRLCLLASIFLLLASCQPGTRTVTVALLGDINLGRGVMPSPDSFTYLTSYLSAANLALANLESPLTPAPFGPDSGYNLCAPSTRAALLADWGLDLISISNNHAIDCAPDGIAQTQSALSQAGLTAITPEPVTLEINGLHLAFLAFDDISSPLDANTAAQAISSARAKGAVVIVSIHWGMEYQGGASDRQKSLARRFAEAGAALVWGHHPHILQPAAWIGSSTAVVAPLRSPLRTFVLYSLGNALFDQGGLADTRQAALVLVEISPNGVQSVRAVPFVIDTTDSRLVAPDAETAEKILDRINIK
jgi:poly-gamma-glutamate synthesis protein (capsule biosynthesis protein)